MKFKQEFLFITRDRSISTAVDSAEIVRNRFATDTEVNEIKLRLRASQTKKVEHLRNFY